MFLYPLYLNSELFACALIFLDKIKVFIVIAIIFIFLCGMLIYWMELIISCLNFSCFLQGTLGRESKFKLFGGYVYHLFFDVGIVLVVYRWVME